MKGKHTENKEAKEKKYTKSFYAVLAVCLCAVGLAGWFTYSDVANYINNPQIPEATTTQPEEKQAEVKVKGVQKETQPPTVNNTQPVTEAENTPPTEATEEVTQPNVQSMVSPVGEKPEIIGDFSDEQLVYFPTLKDWRLHKGIDYAVEKGSNIYSVGSGTVISVFTDTLYGEAVKVENTDGTTVTYYGVKANANIAKDAQITIGDVLGTATGKVPAENTSDSHIHIEVDKNGVFINPKDYIEKE